MKKYRIFLQLFLVAAILLSFSSPALAAPKAKLWGRWLAHDKKSTLAANHVAWGQILEAYIVPREGINRFAYKKVSGEDRKKLDQYITSLSQIPVSKLSRKEQLPYWINLYNALTVQVILNHYPVKSIKDINISPGIFAYGPWDKKLLRIEGDAISLNDIEHRILRPVWKDPRIHYAVNCASIGCPNLQARAYTKENVESLLEKGAREYINHKRGVRIDGSGLAVSSIYTWFSEDFGKNDIAVIEHLRQYANSGLREKLEPFNRISDHSYDWSLNDAP